MHKKLRSILLSILALAALAALAYWFFFVRPTETAQAALTASGTIEITQVQVSAEIGGRVAAVNANDGERVKAGDVLVQVDPTALQAQRAQTEAALAAAQAALKAAQANQALVQAGATAEQLRAAQGQLDQAEAGRKALEASLYALTAGSRPEEVQAAWELLKQARQEYYNLKVTLSSQQLEDVRTAAATAQDNLTQAEARQAGLKKNNAASASALDAAALAVSDAQASLEAATQADEAAQDAGQPFYAQIEAARLSWELAKLKLSQAQARQAALEADDAMLQEALDAAQANVEDAQALVDDAKSAYQSLTSGEEAARLESAWKEAQAALAALNGMGRGATTTTVEALLNQLEAAAALRDAAAANLANLQNGARPEQLDAVQAQVEAAQAQVDAAQAALNTLDVQINKLTLLAPADGVILTRSIEPGEIALPGASLMVLGLDAEKTITVYVPEERYGEITLGQEASLSVDSFPGVSFTARVVNISDKAEFTPRNVQTVEGRKNTVFAIRLLIVDADERLKTGMPADVIFK